LFSQIPTTAIAAPATPHDQRADKAFGLKSKLRFPTRHHFEKNPLD
jgi:hypothetical protein